jgi:hypothetical protein
MTLSPQLRYFVWQYFRALVWVLLCAFALHRAAKNRRVTKSFVLAHLAALGFGALTDAFLLNLAPKAWLVIDFLQWVFLMPIVIFTVMSLWIGHREKEIVVADCFMTLVPIVAWALMVIYGWQMMWFCNVLGAWFVSAACGAVDLYARVGPSWAQRRSYLTRLAGYAVVVMTVYLLLPRTE